MYAFCLETKQRLYRLSSICLVWAGVELLSKVWIALLPYVFNPLFDWFTRLILPWWSWVGRGVWQHSGGFRALPLTFPVISITLLETADRTREELSSGRLHCNSWRHEADEESLRTPAASENHPMWIHNSGNHYQKLQAVALYAKCTWWFHLIKNEELKFCRSQLLKIVLCYKKIYRNVCRHTCAADNQMMCIAKFLL